MVGLFDYLKKIASSEYYRDTPSTVTRNPMPSTGGFNPTMAEGSLMYNDPLTYDDPMAGLSAEELTMYGEAGGITTDPGEESNITITGGSEAPYKEDVDSFLNNLATSGIGDGPEPVDPIRGRLPPMPGMPSSRRGFRPTKSPYGIPSELASQEALQQEISRRIAKQLEQTIVKRPYLNFQGLV
tara:strand:- start:345 stop:896 length:552 start_codon:yes stop_codon:yes gene_type:complete